VRAPGLPRDGIVPLVGTDGARAADAAAEAAGVGRGALMARAAGHLARTALAVGGRAYGLRVDVVVGPGDNGGDGWAAAPRLAAAGAHVRVVVPDGVGAPRSAAASAAREAWLASGGRTVAPDAAAPRADVVLDCLLGTGAAGPLRGGLPAATAWIAAVRSGEARVVACDVPTGVDADTGAVVRGAVVADATVTFGAPRPGLVLHPGAAHAGRVHVGRLGVAHPVDPLGSRWGVLDADGARPRPLAVDAEKRSRGTVLVVAGRVGASGAAALAARGALAAGAGLVRVAVPEPVRAEVAAHHPAAMVVGLPADGDGALHPDAVHALAPHLADVDAVVAGPGLGLGPGAVAVVAALVALPGVLVLDADALNLHRDATAPLVGHPGVLVLTPHERELARLTGTAAAAVRAVAATALAAELDAVVVAKGPGTLVAGPDGTVLVEPPGASALATGGTGDVLAGMVGAVLAGLRASAGTDPGATEAPVTDVLRAVARAVRWHAVAGRHAGAAGAGRTDALRVVDAVAGALAACAAAPAPRDAGPSGLVALAELGIAA
jgi:hydroxyethylthiazole kinase-like uncharacterized protein yjeF